MPADSSYMMLNSGYMHQEDMFVETMTVIEHLWFMVRNLFVTTFFLHRLSLTSKCLFLQARMKLKEKTETHLIREKIDRLLQDVALTSRSNVRIGNGIDDKLLSGGERKRLAFATEVRCNFICV